MGLKATFDPINKLVTLIEPPTSGRVAIDVQRDLYSAAKKDWLDDLALNKYKFPFSTFGGNDLGGGVKAGAYFFIDNVSGWRIRPFEEDHYLELTGNLFGLDADTDIFVPTLGAYSVVIRLTTSSLTQIAVTGSGVTEQDKLDIAGKVWDETL